MSSERINLAFIGFGEAGAAFLGGLDRSAVVGVTAFDRKTVGDDPAERRALAERYQQLGVDGRDSLAEALAGADLVFSVVTADQAGAVAAAAAPLLGEGALFLDCNSCAPQTKQRSARAVDAGAGHYVDVAVMAPVHPKRHRTPLLVSGEHAESALAVLDALNMNARHQAGPVGKASSVKMVRSIMVKGLEALFAECVLAGRLAGVDGEVLESLEASHPGFDWAGRAAYNFERMLRHGERRAAEMEEVCHFLNELGIDEPLSQRTVDWQRRLGGQTPPPDPADYRPTADALIAALELRHLTEDQA